MEWIHEFHDSALKSSAEILLPSSEIVAPPPKELDTLHYLARIGDIKGVEKEANQLKEVDQRYTAFANRLLQLTEEFEEKELLNFIKQYLAGD